MPPRWGSAATVALPSILSRRPASTVTPAWASPSSLTIIGILFFTITWLRPFQPPKLIYCWRFLLKHQGAPTRSDILCIPHTFAITPLLGFFINTWPTKHTLVKSVKSYREINTSCTELNQRISTYKRCHFTLKITLCWKVQGVVAESATNNQWTI